MNECATPSPFQTVKDLMSRSRPARAQLDDQTTILHCINPFPAEPGSEHDLAQRVTFASVRRARQVAAALAPQVRTRLASVVLTGESAASGDLFDEEHVLNRSILDIGRFEKQRRLPVLIDILRAPSPADSDILVYTNADIGLVPQFYLFLRRLFARGIDCAIVNRRTISASYPDAEEIELMSAEASTPHPGFDCFAFRASLRERLVPFDSCIGIGGVMLPLLYNLLAFAEEPAIVLDAHATFHLGNDETWRSSDFNDYSAFNRRQIDHVFQTLIDNPAVSDFFWPVFPKHTPDGCSPTVCDAGQACPSPMRHPSGPSGRGSAIGFCRGCKGFTVRGESDAIVDRASIQPVRMMVR